MCEALFEHILQQCSTQHVMCMSQGVAVRALRSICHTEADSDALLMLILQVLQAAFQRVAVMMAQGQAAPIQALTFPFADVTTALRQFSHTRHIGKVVTWLPPAAEPASGEQV